jgi:hypothetical protein
LRFQRGQPCGAFRVRGMTGVAAACDPFWCEGDPFWCEGDPFG